LIPASRRQKILNLIREKHTVEVDELVTFFQVSAVTIRQDLNFLADQNLITRARGGAVLASWSDSELAFADRIEMNAEKKQRIGNLAAGLIESNTSIFLDASTTVVHVARALKQRYDLEHVTVVTNGINTALELVDRPDITTILTGGILSSRNISLNSLFVEDQLKTIHGQRGFFGARGLSLKHGLTEVTIQDAQTKILMMERCQEIIAIADNSKFDQVASVSLASLDRIHRVVTDRDAPAEMVSELRSLGIDVMLA